MKSEVSATDGLGSLLPSIKKEDLKKVLYNFKPRPTYKVSEDYEKLSSMSSTEAGGESADEVTQRKRKLVSHIAKGSPLSKALRIGPDGI